MKITYEFVTGEISEVEVDERLGGMLLDLDRQQYNNEQKETRRHVSLDGMDYEGELFVSAEDTEGEAERREDMARLFSAMEVLSPDQRELVEKVYFEERTFASIAREEGVGESAIRDRMKRIHKKLEKNLN
ncbi:MAG: sigma-70 family RNA polymerase sigma factor [Lachnospiraceae bacterium]|nr:sigma-70 family RNA polymerase sigma factor [Lachnospiraceae bacterium]